MKRLLLVLGACFAFAFNAYAVVNINSASQAELETITGVGPAKARAIIEYRTKTPFKSVDELDQVKGFGKKSIDKIRKDLSVSGATSTTAPIADKARVAGNETAAAAGKTAESKTVKTDDKSAKQGKNSM